MMRRHTAAPFLLVFLLAAGCGADCPEATGLSVHFDPTFRDRGSEAATWLAFPFPADFRRTDQGTIRLSDFPNPNDSDLLRDFIRHGEAELDGFAIHPAIYVAFDAPLDTAALASDPSAYLTTDAPLQLIDVTPSSPEYGRRFPLVWQYTPTDGKYVSGATLTVAPAWGFPLRERTSYALVLTTELRGIDGSRLRQDGLSGWLCGALERDCVPERVGGGLRDTLRSAWSPLRKRLEDDPLPAARVAAATVFTTQDISSELAAIRRFIHEELPAPEPRADGWQAIGPAGESFAALSFQWSSSETVDYYRLEGRYPSPNFQHGNLPYAAPRDGGGFRFDGDVPLVDHTEELRFVLTVPEAPPADGGSCYPVVLYAHGTGGTAYGFSTRTGGRLAARGLAAIGIDQPLHGLRNEGTTFDVNLMSFNYFNPEAVRANFRQSVADTFSLVRMVRETFQVPAAHSPNGASICFDPTRIGFFGHSHGGLTGAMAIGFEPDVDAWTLSGGGGGLAITVMERKDFADIEELFRLFLWLEADDEPLSELHPTVRLVQTLADITDPSSYTRAWLPRSATEHANLFITSGQLDQQTPHRTATALAVGGGVPVVEPVAIDVPGFGWRGLDPVRAPVTGNATGATVGFMQWANDLPCSSCADHFVIFNRPEAINASMRFFESAAYEATAVLERDPDADAR